jgi:hypothetical protein
MLFMASHLPEIRGTGRIAAAAPEIKRVSRDQPHVARAAAPRGTKRRRADRLQAPIR